MDSQLRWIATARDSPSWWKLASSVKHEGVVRFLLTELKECKSLLKGEEIHRRAIESGHDTYLYVANSLSRMYAKCGSMADARQVFESIKQPDVVSWNTLILGYVENGEAAIALDLFTQMKSQCCNPDAFTYVAALKACTSLALKRDGRAKAELVLRGRQIHTEIGPESLDTYVESALIAMYAACGGMAEARQVFDSAKSPDLISWNALILGYAMNGKAVTALDLFERMQLSCVPDSFTFVAALKACTSIAMEEDGPGKTECMKIGRKLHLQACSSSVASFIHVQSTLIDMYANCGSMVNAQKVFDGIKHPDVVPWTALIMGYADNGQAVTALDYFATMKAHGFVPDSFTYVAALKACSILGALEPGRKIHAELTAAKMHNMILVTSLVDFYVKCGCLEEAQQIFDMKPRRDLKTWTALIAGYSCMGDEKAVFKLFHEMRDAGYQPNGVTLLCILACCSNSGLVGKARQFFEAMSVEYGIVPTVEHYTCMVDMLGRSNMLDDVLVFLQDMPWRPNSVTWKTLLGSCRKFRNVGIARLAFESLMCLDETENAAYVLMAQIYGSRIMFDGTFTEK